MLFLISSIISKGINIHIISTDFFFKGYHIIERFY